MTGEFGRKNWVYVTQPSLLYFPTCKEYKISLVFPVSSCTAQVCGCSAPGWLAFVPNSDSKVPVSQTCCTPEPRSPISFLSANNKSTFVNLYPRGSLVSSLFRVILTKSFSWKTLYISEECVHLLGVLWQIQ